MLQPDEVYSIQLSMLELQKVKKDMFLLGKLQVLANATDVIHHSRQEVNVQCRHVSMHLMATVCAVFCNTSVQRC